MRFGEGQQALSRVVPGAASRCRDPAFASLVRTVAARSMEVHSRKDQNMPASPKRSAPAVVKRAPKKPVEPVSRPSLRFYHSHELRVKTLDILVMVENAEKATAHAGELTELVLELTDHGMDQYFLQSLKATKANFVVQQSAALGLAGVQKVMGTVIRNMLGRMDDRQLLSVCGSIRQFMA